MLNAKDIKSLSLANAIFLPITIVYIGWVCFVSIYNENYIAIIISDLLYSGSTDKDLLKSINDHILNVIIVPVLLIGVYFFVKMIQLHRKSEFKALNPRLYCWAMALNGLVYALLGFSYLYSLMALKKIKPQITKEDLSLQVTFLYLGFMILTAFIGGAIIYYVTRTSLRKSKFKTEQQ